MDSSRRRVARFLGPVLAMCAAALAGVISRPSAAQGPAGGPVAFTGARVLDGTGRVPYEPGTVVVADGRILAAGPSGSVTVPAGATRIDLTGKTLMPGLISAHSHANADPTSGLSVSDDLLRRLRTYADYGVTTVYNLGSVERDEAESFRLRDQPPADRARLFTSGLVINAKSEEEGRRAVDRNADLRADVIKFRIDGNPNDMPPNVYGAVIDQAHRRGLRTAAHMFYLRDAHGVVDKEIDLLAHSVRDQDVDAALIAKLKARDIGLVPTLTRDLSLFVYETRPAFFDEPFFTRGMPLFQREYDLLNDPAQQERTRNSPPAQAAKKALEQALRNLKILSDAGVAVGMGTDTGAAGTLGRWPGYFEHTELELMVKAGLTPMQTLVAATRGAAHVARLEDRVGTLTPGKWADLLVLSADPLVDIRNTRQIDSVWVGGRRVTTATTRPTR